MLPSLLLYTQAKQMSKPMKLSCTLQCHSVTFLAMRECQIHTLAPTAQVDLLCRQVDLLSAAHFCTDLEQPEMVKTDKKDTGGAMETHTRSAKIAMDNKLQ